MLMMIIIRLMMIIMIRMMMLMIKWWGYLNLSQGKNCNDFHATGYWLLTGPSTYSLII